MVCSKIGKEKKGEGKSWLTKKSIGAGSIQKRNSILWRPLLSRLYFASVFRWGWRPLAKSQQKFDRIFWKQILYGRTTLLFTTTKSKRVFCFCFRFLFERVQSGRIWLFPAGSGKRKSHFCLFWWCPVRGRFDYCWNSVLRADEKRFCRGVYRY